MTTGIRVAGIRVAGVIICAVLIGIGLVRANAPEAPADYSCIINHEAGIQANDFCCRGSLHRTEGDFSGLWQRA